MKLTIEFRGEMPEGWVELESVAVVKCLDQDGDPALVVRASQLNPWEALGMLIAASDATRSELHKMFDPTSE